MTTAAEMQIVVELKDKASASLKNVNNSFSKTAKGVTSGVTKMAAGFGLLLGAAAIGGVVVGLKKSVSAFIDFEDSIAGVAKTTGLTGKSLEEVSVAIKKLSTTIPVAAVELADIAAIAGQLGIQGTDNILSFTKTVSEIAVAFDMTAEQAATAMAKLGNIYKIPIEQTSNLASAINVLGNTTAASETQLSAFGMSLGAATVNLGFTATESMSLGATLISMGMDASDAGTRLNSAFTKMANNIDKVSGFLGITEVAFKDAFGADPMGMVIKIVEKLSTIEDPLERAATASELFGIVGSKAITGLGGDLAGLQTNLVNSATGFKENTSLAEEFAAKTNTLKASMELLKNNLTAVAITIGSKLAPYIRDVADKMSVLLPLVDNIADSFSGGFGKGILASASALKDKLQPGLDSLKNSFNSIISIISSLITSFSSNESAMTSMASIVNVVVDAFNFCAVALEYVLNIMAKYPVITAAVVAAIVLLLSPIAAVIAAIGVLAVAWDLNWLGIKDTTLKVVSFIVSYLKGEFAKLEAFWSVHGATIMAIVDFMWTSIKTMIEATVGTILLIINVFLNILSGDWSAAWDKITAYLSTAMDNQKSLSESFKTMMLAIFSSLWTALLSGIEGLKTGMLTIFTSLWAALLSGIEGWKTGMLGISASLWTTLLSSIEGLKMGMLGVAASLWSALLAGFEGYKTMMVSISSVLWTALLSGFEGLRTGMLGVAASLWITLLSGVEGLKTGMMAIFSSLWTAILSGIEGLKTGMLAISTSLWATLLSSIEGLKTGMVAVAASLWTTLLSGIEGLKTGMTSVSASLWAALLSGIEGLKTAMLGVSTSLWATLISGFEGLKTAMLGISASLWTALLSGFEGLKTGMLAISTSLWSALTLNIKIWASDTISNFTKWVSDTISNFENFKNTTISTINDWVSSTLSSLVSWITDTSNRISTWTLNIISSFENWKNTVISIINDWMSSTSSVVTGWAADTLNKITTWISDTLNRFTQWTTDTFNRISSWATDTLNRISSWAADSFNRISSWAADTFNRISSWAADTFNRISSWATDTFNRISSWTSDTLNRISSWASDTLNRISTWAANTTSKISSWAADTSSKISSWAKNTSSIISSWTAETYKKITTWTSNVISSFTNWKNSVISIISGWYNAIKRWFDFSGIRVKWPSIPNPFKGMDWCKYIPRWVKNVLGVCGGTVPYSKYDKYSKYNKYSKHQIYDRAGARPPNLYSKYSRAYLTGGPVPEDLNADLHKGEYVVPKAGVLVKGGSSKPSHIQMTYNIDTVNGVDNIKRLLDKHDRDLYKRLVAMV